jgi:subtilisin family serine protease
MAEIVGYNPLFRKVLFVFTLLVLVFSNIGNYKAYASDQLHTSATLAVQPDKPVDQVPEGIDPDKPIRAIVQFIDPPLASYRGSYPGLSATSPRVTGARKLDLGSPASQAYLQYLDNAHVNFDQALNSVMPGAQVERSYKLALNGSVVKTTAGNLNTLRGLPGVKAVTLEKHFKPSLDAVIPLIGLGTGLVGDPTWVDNGLWAALGGHSLAGKGIKIADIDTGITPDHPCFSGIGYSYPSGFPKGDTSVTNGKIIAAYAYFTPGDPPYYTATPVDDPEDGSGSYGGHGTHTAGVMACNYGTPTNFPNGVTEGENIKMSGIAPKAQLMIYRVFYRSVSGQDGGFTPELIAAIDQAIEDGADVVNNSWGGDALDSNNDPEVAAYSAAVDAGLVVVFAAGNDGSSMTINSPGFGEKFITVGSSTSNRVFDPSINAVTTDPLGLNVAAMPGDGPFFTTTSTFDYIYSSGNPYARNAFAPGTLSGKIAIIERDSLTSFYNQVNHAASGNAAGVVIVESRDGAPSYMYGLGGTTIPAIMIPKANGIYFTTTSPNGTLTFNPAETRIVYPAFGDLLTDFSSRGPTADMRIKPDLTAPGIDILSSVSARTPGGLPTFEIGGGTSASTPQVTAAAALLKQAHPTWTPAQIKSALMSTAAEPASLGKNPINRGSGRLNLGNTNRPDQVLVTFDQPSLNFGVMPISTSKTLGVSADNTTSSPVSYAIKVIKSAGVDQPMAASTVSIAGGSSAVIPIDLSITASGYDGYGEITLTPLVPHQSSPVLHIPYWVRAVVDLGEADVFLVDDDQSYNPSCADYRSYYTTALDNLGLSYVVWDVTATSGIDFNVARRYSKAIYFSGDCGSSLTFQPVSLRNYLAQGGKMIISGQNIGSLDNNYYNSTWQTFDPGTFFGARYVQDSLYGTKLPPIPAMDGDFINSDFLQGQSYDIRPGGDGAANQTSVDEIDPIYSTDTDSLPILTSRPVSTRLENGILGTRASSEPTIERAKGDMPWTHLGFRTIWLSFGLEGVNNTSGFDSREDLLARAIGWLDDSLSITPDKTSVTIKENNRVNLTATPKTSFTDGLYNTGYVNDIRYYRWDFGDSSPILYGGASMTHIYSGLGTYKVYIEVGDGFGHRAVAGPILVTVGKYSLFLPLFLKADQSGLP